jgi:hypothetical protein
VSTGSVKDRPMMALKDLPASGQTVELWWRKRRLVCREALCPRKTFTQASAAVRPRDRVTEWLRARVAMAIASGNRAVSEYQVLWSTAHKALTAAAVMWPLAPSPTRLGEPAAAAHRRLPPVSEAVETARTDARQPRPDQPGRRCLGT